MIKMKYFIKSGTWSLLDAQFEYSDEPTNAINTATQLTIVCFKQHYAQLSTYTAAYTGASTAKLICVTPDDVTAANLNASFDDYTKLWLGRLVEVRHTENLVYLKAQEITAGWLREPIDIDDNIHSDPFDDTDDYGLVKSITDKDTIVVEESDNVATAWSNDDYNGNTIRFTAKTAEAEGIDYATTASTSADAPSDAESGGIAEIDDHDNTYFDGESTNELTADDADFVMDLTFTVPECITPRFKLHLELCFVSENSGQFPLGGYGTFDTGAVKLYNYVTGDWDTVYVPENPLAHRVYADRYILDFDVDDISYYSRSSSTVATRATSVIKARVYSGYWQNYWAGNTNYFANTAIYYAYVTTTHGFQHAPIEFSISDTVADTSGSYDGLDLSIDADDFNLYTEFINTGDKIEILYENEKWLEDFISAYGSQINAINAPSASSSTYTKMNFKTVKQNVQEIVDREKWYWYQTRTTTSTKPDVTFVEKATPTNNGLLATPDNIDGDGNVVVLYNALNKCRGVVVKNKDGYACYGDDGAAGTTTTFSSITDNDLPIIVLNRPEIPTLYLEDVAQAIYEQRNSVPEIITFNLLNINIYDEHFQWYDEDHRIRDETNDVGGSWNAWTVTADCDFTAVTKNGRKWGKLTDDNNAGSVIPIYTFSESRTIASGDYIEFDIEHVDNGNLYIFIYGGGTQIAYISLGVTTFSSYYDPGGGLQWNTVGTVTSGYNRIRVELGDVNGSQRDLTIIAYYSDADSETVSDLTRNSGTTWDTVRFQTSYSSVNQEKNIGDIACSWLNQGSDIDVQDAAADKLHAGANVHVLAAPTTKGGTDYQVDDDFVIREMKWTHDEQLQVQCGFAEYETQSPEETVIEILERQSHESTS